MVCLHKIKHDLGVAFLSASHSVGMKPSKWKACVSDMYSELFGTCITMETDNVSTNHMTETDTFLNESIISKLKY